MRFSSGYFHGTILKNRSMAAGGIKLSETTYASALRLTPHSHEGAYFCYVLQGSFTENYERSGSRSCRQSSLIFHPAGETHSDYFHSDARCFNIQIDDHWFGDAQAAADSKMISAPADFFDSRLSFLAARLYREFREFDQFSALIIEGLTIELLAEASRRCFRKQEKANPPPRWLRRAKEILDEQFDEKLTLPALSGLVSVHPTHLAREFRRFYSCSVGEYVRRRRVEIAARQISKTDATFAEIASAVGFFDQSHFARVFKSETGMTPQEYRKSLRFPR